MIKTNLGGLNTISYRGFSIFANLSIDNVKNIILAGSLNDKMVLFQTMLAKDSQIIGDFRKARIQIGALDYKIEGDKSAIAFLEEMFQELDFDSLLHDLTTAIGFGFAPIELSWELKDGTWRPTKYQFIKHSLIHKEPITNRLYFFNDNGERIFLDSNPAKYLNYLHRGNSGFIEDFGLFNSLAWSFVVTDFIYSNYLNYTDMLGTPPLIAIGDADKPEDILDQLLMLRDGNVGVIPENFKIQLLEAKGSGDHFLKVIEYLDKKKSNILLGGNLNSDSGSHGSQSLGETQAKNKDQILWFDTAILQRFINKFIKTSLQFSKYSNSDIKFKFIYQNEQEKVEENSRKFPVLINFEEENIDQIEKHIDQYNFSKVSKEINYRVIELLENSKSKEELLESIYLEYGHLNFSALEKELEKAIFNAQAEGLSNW